MAVEQPAADDRPDEISGFKRTQRSALTGAFFVALAVLITWPLALHLETDLPQGSEPVATVQLLNAWTIWWNAESARRGFAGYWNAPIFSPTERAFAFSETQPTSLAVAPIVWLTGSSIVAYNLYLILNLALNGWFAYALVMRTHKRFALSIIGGVFVMLLPFTHWQFGVLQLVPIWGILWCLAALWRFGETGETRAVFSAGAAIGVTYLLCNYYGLFLCLILSLGFPLLIGPRINEWATWKRLILCPVVAAVIIAPIAVSQWQQSREHDWHRNDAIVRELSAKAGDYATLPATRLHLAVGNAERRMKERPLCPGCMLSGLALIGLVIGMWKRDRRHWTLACAVLLLIAFALSLGLNLSIFGVQPFEWLRRFVPGMAQVRSVFRFAVFTQLMTVLLAIEGIAALRDGVARIATCRSDQSDRRTTPGMIATALFALLVAIELYPAVPNLYEVPNDDTGYVQWLRKNTEPDDVIACFPFPEASTDVAYQRTALRMLQQSRHGRPMVNGYSGYFPQQYVELQESMRGFPNAEAIQQLRSRNVRYCIIRRYRRRPKNAPVPAGLKRVYGDEESRFEIYELLSP